ncbi:MAG TPA: DNA polymerase III subunit delta, partial [Pyrinomonadaceae bacterium]
MATLTREELWRELKAGKVGPLYLLFGPEDYLRDAAARAVADAALKGSPLREFNESSFDLTSADVQHAIAAAEQMPMMGGRRVVFVTGFIRKHPRAPLPEADEEALVRYVTRPVETSTVVFVADNLDKRLKLSKTLLDVCASVEFAELKDAELTGWARDRLKHLGAHADERALRQTIALAGPSVRRVATELEKLATAALPGGQVTTELVDELVGRSRELSNFELSDHL